MDVQDAASDSSLPRVEVVIPTFRRPQWLQRAVRSVQQQTYENLKISIYDNASGDATAEICAALARSDPRIHYQTRPSNIGAIASFADAMTRVDSPMFCLMGDDDMLAPGFLSEAVPLLDRNPDAGVAVFTLLHADASGAINKRKTWKVGRFEAPRGVLGLLQFHFSWQAMLFRACVLKAAGPLDVAIGAVADLEFLIRAFSVGAVVTSASVGAIMAVHENCWTWNLTTGEVMPGWAETVARVRKDPRLPDPIRSRLLKMMYRCFATNMFLRDGPRALFAGDFAGARAISDAVEAHFGSPFQAKILRLLGSAFAAWPASHRAFRRCYPAARALAKRARRTVNQIRTGSARLRNRVPPVSP